MTALLSHCHEAAQKASDLPDAGGPLILLPAAALLFLAGVLTFVIVRRK